MWSHDGKKIWKPDDWHCNMCDFKIFGTKDHCFKCGLLKSQWCCCSCKHITDNNPLKCPKCGKFNLFNDEYAWIIENGSKEEKDIFVILHPNYTPCRHGGLRVHCWKCS